nr:acyltransferase [Motilibacter aurantiacus]
MNQGTVVHCESAVTIGSRVRIGDLCAVYDTNFHEIEPGAGVRTAPVTIGDDVWLARGVVVLPGTAIGEGSVVAAGSVVRGEVPPWVVVAGNPAVVVRTIEARGRRR